MVIVNPAHVFGRGDVYHSSTDLVRRFLRRSRPTWTARSTSSTCPTSPPATCSPTSAGIPGERYILGNRNYTLDRLFADLGRLSGVEPPAAQAFPRPRGAGAGPRGPEAGPGRPLITVNEVRAAAQWWTYRNTKAKRELGFGPRPHEGASKATIAWYREREGGSASGARRAAPLRNGGFALRQAGASARPPGVVDVA